MDLRKNLQSETTSSTQLESSPLLKNETRPLTFSQKVSSLFNSPQRLWSTTLVALIAALTSMLGGYAIGYPSSSLLDLRNMTDGRSIMNGSVLVNVYGAITPVGALFGGAIAGSSADILGRKPTLIITVVPCFIGWTLIAVSWFIHKAMVFKIVLLVGRFISGFGLGWALLSAPVYIGEVSIPSLRGLYSSLPQLMLTVGILVVDCVGAIPDTHFYQTAFVASGITVILLPAIFLLPETPRYLITKGKPKEALKTLLFLRGTGVNVQEELLEIEEAIAKQRKLSCGETLRELTHRNVYLPFILMVFIMIFQQTSGVNAVVFYSAPILHEAGFGKNSNFVAALTVGLTTLIFTLVNTLSVDFFGRKILLLASGTVMSLSSLGLGYAMRYPNLSPLAVASVIGFQIGFCIGYGAIPWIMIAEMIPLRVRGTLGGVLAAVNWGFAALVTGFYFVYANSIGHDVAWWTFALMNLISVAFVAIFLPETKGQKLEIMEQQMMNRYKFCT